MGEPNGWVVPQVVAPALLPNYSQIQNCSYSMNQVFIIYLLKKQNKKVLII